jgi:hypothetical protein
MNDKVLPEPGGASLIPLPWNAVLTLHHLQEKRQPLKPNPPKCVISVFKRSVVSDKTLVTDSTKLSQSFSELRDMVNRVTMRAECLNGVV